MRKNTIAYALAFLVGACIFNDCNAANTPFDFRVGYDLAFEKWSFDTDNDGVVLIKSLEKEVPTFNDLPEDNWTRLANASEPGPIKGVNTNANSAPVGDFRSNLALQFRGSIPTTQPLYARVALVPVLTNYHVTQSRTINGFIVGSIGENSENGGWDFTAFQQRVYDDNNEQISQVNSARFNFNRKRFNDMGNNPLHGFAFAGTIRSETNPYYEFSSNAARIYGDAGLFYLRDDTISNRITVGYRFNITRNLEKTVIYNDRTMTRRNPITGLTETILTGYAIFYSSNDYEYNIHQINTQYDRRLLPNWRFKLNSAIALTQYVNVDSAAIINNEKWRRINPSFLMGGEIETTENKELTFFLNASALFNYSNRPVGNTINPNDTNQVFERDSPVVTFQNGNLGRFQHYVVAIGMRLHN